MSDPQRTDWQPIETVPPFGVVEVRSPIRHPVPIAAEMIEGEWWAAGQLGLQLNWQPTEWRDVHGR